MKRTRCIAVAALAAAITPSYALGAGRGRRKLGLGKWKDGPPTQIDCSASTSDYSYYIEKCWDETTQWWINGRCISGEKEEVSELHKCMRPDGSLPYCHDCLGGDGYVKNVCGAETPDKDKICDVAWAATGEDCGEQELTVYSHQCKVPTGDPTSWYLREAIYCASEEVDSSGPNMERYQVPTEFTCGAEWYYEYDANDPLLAEYPDLVGKDHPFATGDYCLDCGMAIQVCASNVDATCASLGLPEKGEEFAGTLAPWMAPPALWTISPSNYGEEENGGLPEKGGEFASTLAPWMAPPALSTIPPSNYGEEENGGGGEAAAVGQGANTDAGATSSAYYFNSNGYIDVSALVVGFTTILFSTFCSS